MGFLGLAQAVWNTEQDRGKPLRRHFLLAEKGLLAVVSGAHFNQPLRWKNQNGSSTDSTISISASG